MLSAFVYAHIHTQTHSPKRSHIVEASVVGILHMLPHPVQYIPVKRDLSGDAGTSPVQSSSPRHKSNLFSVLAADNGKPIGREINAQNIRSALCSNAALNRKTSDVVSS